jgi:hypothetical protein
MRKIDDVIDSALSRRKFLVGAGGAAALTAVGAVTANAGPAKSPKPDFLQTPVTDVDILNFALNLEYLEAEFYLRAATGSGLSDADAGPNAGAVIGGSQVTFATAIDQQYANEIAQDELNHVRFLRSALGSAAVSRPAIDLTNSFNAAAAAAGIGSSFDPFASPEAFLVGAFVFEDVGVTAYHGAAGLLTNKTYLGAAAGIMAVEAYHAAEVRARIVRLGDPYLTYANQISHLRSELGGGGETHLSDMTVVACTPGDAIAYARSTREVLHIVYATTSLNTSSGGFFPNGLNGKIKTILG